MPHPHHQRPGGAVTECHAENGSQRQHCFQNRLHRIRINLVQQALRQFFPSVTIEQNPVVVIHTSEIHPALLTGGMPEQQGQGRIYPPSEEGMHHDLAVSRVVGKMFHQNRFIVGEPSGRLNLP